MRKRLKLQLLAGEKWTRVQMMGHLNLIVENPLWMPALQARIELVIGNPFLESFSRQRVCLPVRAHGKSEMNLPLVSTGAGMIRLTAERMEIQDILGLLWVTADTLAELEYTVYPKTDAAEGKETQQLSGGISESEEGSTRGNDFSEVSDIREYIPGDRLKDIHWKLSAKRDVLMVKERVNLSQSRLVLLLDLSGDSIQRNAVIAESWRLCAGILEQNMQILLLWWNEQLQTFGRYSISSEEELRIAYGEVFGSWSGIGREELKELMQKHRAVSGSYVLAFMRMKRL